MFTKKKGGEGRKRRQGKMKESRKKNKVGFKFWNNKKKVKER